MTMPCGSSHSCGLRQHAGLSCRAQPTEVADGPQEGVRLLQVRAVPALLHPHQLSARQRVQKLLSGIGTAHWVLGEPTRGRPGWSGRRVEGSETLCVRCLMAACLPCLLPQGVSEYALPCQQTRT